MELTTILKKSILATSITLLFSSTQALAKSDDTHKMHQLYQDNCASCHGADHGGYLAPALNAETLKGRSPTALRTLIMTGALLIFGIILFYLFLVNNYI